MLDIPLPPMVPTRKNQIQTIRPGMDECAADQSHSAKLMNALAKIHDIARAIVIAATIPPMMIVFVIPTIFILWAAFVFHPPPRITCHPTGWVAGRDRKGERKTCLSRNILPDCGGEMEPLQGQEPRAPHHLATPSWIGVQVRILFFIDLSDLLRTRGWFLR